MRIFFREVFSLNRDFLVVRCMGNLESRISHISREPLALAFVANASEV